MNLADLKDFCADKNFGRPALENYWVRNGFAYATNGHILIRISIDEPDTISEVKFPNAKLLIDEIKDNCNCEIDFSQQIDFVKKPVYKLISEAAICDYCKGEGDTECNECGADKTCERCNGSGQTSKNVYSDEVVGEELTDQPFIKILNAYFNQKYIFLIQKYFPMMGIIKAIGETTSMKIEFGDVLIVLMPLRWIGIEKYFELKILKEAL